MKAAVFDRYGPPEVLHITKLDQPQINNNEILVRVKAVAVTAADARIRAARFPKGFGFLARLAFGIVNPRMRVLGSTYSGVVEKVGEDVVDFKAGDEVCGMTGVKMGTYAEYIAVGKFSSVAKKPKQVSHIDAAGMLFGGTAALYFVRDKLCVKKGESVVVNGASGAVGTNAVQLAKYFGANVTGVTSGDHAKLVKNIGAEAIIDYTKQNIIDSTKTFDVVLDTVGNISPEAAKGLLNGGGRAGLMVASLGEMLRARGAIKVGTATEKRQDIELLLSLVEQKKLKVIIDKVYKLEEVVSAHTHADTGKKVGNIVLEFNGN